ncbi:MAG: hypothetical protein PHQ05_10115 [Sterolibacterium sp.]|nr:hypothetical protein [Sterolibacterium sp.]
MNITQLTPAEFFGTPVSILDHAGKRWLTAEEAGRCLGYNDANTSAGIRNLYTRHADEFSEEDACRISLMRQGQNRESLIFSATGCQKLGFFANTCRAKDFRTWAAKVLAAQTYPIPLPTSPLTGEERLDRLDANMATLAESMNMLLMQKDLTSKYIGLLELNQQGKRKMTAEIREQITALAAEGMNNADIGRLLRVSRTAVSLYLAGKYRSLPEGATPQKPVEEILEGWIQREKTQLLTNLLSKEG